MKMRFLSQGFIYVYIYSRVTVQFHVLSHLIQASICTPNYLVYSKIHLFMFCRNVTNI